MENATKALIIAGAVLIALVLIGVSVTILGSMNGVDKGVKSTTDAIAVETFNSTFMNFIGRQSRSQVSTLLSHVNSSNLNNSTHTVKVYVNNTEKTIAEARSALTNSYYTVEIKSQDANGYITGINIK